MKRDMDLVRKLLFLIEDQDKSNLELKIPSDLDRGIVVYHLKLLEQTGYTENTIKYADDKPLWIYCELTWDGHEFLNAVRNENVWKKLKERIGSDISSLPLVVISQVAIEAAKVWTLNKLGLNSK